MGKWPQKSGGSNRTDNSKGDELETAATTPDVIWSSLDSMKSGSTKRKLLPWLFRRQESAHAPTKDSWWKVMCLTGVDYFSSIGFQPSIAFVATGILSPFATLFLVAMNLFGALPAYWHVAEESPHGQGSLHMLEKRMDGWAGKLFILALLSFAATGFLFTITVCTADAAVHFVQNPWVPPALRHPFWVTIALILMLGAVFLKGFREAIGVSFILVGSYLALNAVTLSVCFNKLLHQPQLFQDWISQLHQHHSDPTAVALASALAFPQLVLGMSGFETGVAVMPLIRGDADDDPQNLTGRIRNTRKLLSTAAIVMAVLLIVSSVVTTMMIPAPLYAEGQPANGRALAYLAHEHLGNMFGSVYDFVTIFILWFAGASTMAALLSLVPHYLPRYGMAPQWAAAQRPLILFFTAACCLITFIFHANVDKQSGAFATGLLVLLTSACLATLLSVWRRPLQRLYFIVVTLCFIYADIANMTARVDGLLTALCLLAIIFTTSFASRSFRSTELRVTKVLFDETARGFINRELTEDWKVVRLLAHRPVHPVNYRDKEQEAREAHSIQAEEGDFLFLEVSKEDSSDFLDDELHVEGVMIEGYSVLRCKSPSVPNAIAATLLQIRDETGQIPHAYFGWTEGHPLGYILKFIFFGEGETAPLTREILREYESDPKKRPIIHVA